MSPKGWGWLPAPEAAHHLFSVQLKSGFNGSIVNAASAEAAVLYVVEKTSPNWLAEGVTVHRLVEGQNYRVTSDHKVERV